MDIQGYILDHWLAKMKPESPVLTIYDKDGIYYDLLPLAKEKGIKVIDTTKGLLNARLSASRFWCNELSLNKDSRMIIYRKRSMPTNNRDWVEEPFISFSRVDRCFLTVHRMVMKTFAGHSFLPSRRNWTSCSNKVLHHST